MQSPKMPPGTEIIRTYAEYGNLIDGFFRGCYQLLFIVGRPGLAKSYEIEQRLGQAGHLIKGWAAPLQAYIEAYRYRNQPLIFDDAEVLWKRPGGRILIRSLTEHRPRKHIQWRSTAKELTKARVPQSFYTTSKIAILANRFAFGSEEEREAVLDRGHLVLFDPLPLEVHQRVGDWFWCQEIYDYIGARLHMLDSPSMRTYLKAWERQQAGGNWKKLIGDVFCHNNATLLVQALESDPDCGVVDDRVRKFIDQTGLSRATYFNIKRELKNNDQLASPMRIDVPRRTLRGTPPRVEDTEIGDHDVDSEIHGDPGTQRQLEEPALPPWCEYSDNPNDYADYADYLADWWKRPQPTEPLESTNDPDGRLSKKGSDWRHHEMRQAIEREDYERAAQLRDEIRRLERGNQEDTE
jgi:hypothetical protein